MLSQSNSIVFETHSNVILPHPDHAGCQSSPGFSIKTLHYSSATYPTNLFLLDRSAELHFMWSTTWHFPLCGFIHHPVTWSSSHISSSAPNSWTSSVSVLSLRWQSKFYTHKIIGNIVVLYILSFLFMEVYCKKILDRTAVDILWIFYSEMLFETWLILKTSWVNLWGTFSSDSLHHSR